MSEKKRMYVVLQPHPSLIGSQLPPEDFARHYISGSARHYGRKIIFAELDIAFRHPYFKIDEAMEEVKTHADGRPKATKFIKTYRVLEHLDLSRILHVFLSDSDGRCLRLEPCDLYAPLRGKPAGGINFFAELCPMKIASISQLNYKDFGQHMTNPANSKGAPAICYTQLDLDAQRLLDDDAYLREITFSVLPGADGEKLRQALRIVRDIPEKPTKGILMEIDFSRISYTRIRHGIMLCNHEQMALFGMPALQDIQAQNPAFYAGL